MVSQCLLVFPGFVIKAHARCILINFNSPLFGAASAWLYGWHSNTLFLTWDIRGFLLT